MHLSDLTFFYDHVNDAWSYGPILRYGRRYAACGLVNGGGRGRAVVITGGWDGTNVLSSTEILFLDDNRSRIWRRGVPFPFPVTSTASIQKDGSFLVNQLDFQV